MPRSYYEIQPSDVGRARIAAFGRTWPVVDFLGRVLPLDVGKRVYESGGVLQVENEEQRRFRMRVRT